MAAHAAAAAAQAARTTAAARVLSRSSAKPPNILVLCDTNPQSPSNGVTHYQQTKSELTSCIGHDKYVVYGLMLEDLGQVPWRENCQLLIAPAGLNMAAATLQCLVGYVEEGGQCLSMSKSLSEAVLGCHGAAVEQSQLCQVTPCVPGKEQLEGFVAPLLFLAGTEKKEVSYSPLAKLCDAGSESPCVQLVDTTPAHSQFVASSVDLLSPSFEGLNISMVTELKQSTQARHLFLSEVLEQLGVECDPAPVPALSHTYLFSKSDKQLTEFLSHNSFVRTTTGQCCPGNYVPLVDTTTTTTNVTITTEDYSKSDSTDAPLPSSTHLSVLTHPPSSFLKQMDFDISQYFEYLRTSKLGHVVLYTPVIASTQTVFTGNVKFTTKSSTSGVICIAGQQTQGKGRGGNEWISPKGCMMFSLPLNIPSSSRLSRCSSILQHIVALSVVSAIRTLPGYEALEVEIKWPNDIYYKRQIKLGGILVTAFTIGADTTATIGCGVNVANHYPTMSLNDCIALHQQEHADKRDVMEPLSVEQLLSLTLNKMELYIRLYDKWGLNGIQDLYYQYWMHGGSTVQLADSPQVTQTVTITGVDEFGYLRVLNEEGHPLTVRPDGNTFDIMKGLIAMKH